MTTPIREAALAAIATRLAAQITDAPIERARRAPVDVEQEQLPRIVLAGIDWAADETAEPMVAHYTLGFAVTGYCRARSDLALDQALAALHARVVAALSGWTPTDAGLGEPAEEGAEFTALDPEESKLPAGSFVARFSMLCLAGLGSPYAA
jgi:hypothetical protein